MSGTVSAHRGNCIQSGSIIVIAMMPDRRYTYPITRRPKITTVVRLPTALSSSMSL